MLRKISSVTIIYKASAIEYRREKKGKVRGFFYSKWDRYPGKKGKKETLWQNDCWGS